MVQKQQLEVRDAEAMEALGAGIAGAMAGSGVIFLAGELGTGKTTLVRGALRHLGHHGPVKSPTFTLVEPYEINGRRIFHFDLYRLTDPEELEYMGIRDYLDGEALCFVEWPERGAGSLPVPELRVEIAYCGTARRVEILAAGPRGGAILSRATGGMPAHDA